jgi:CheY-like chemotaxis protein
VQHRKGPSSTLAEAPCALIVEDDPKSAELIRLQLEAEGFKVVVVGSAEDAIRHGLTQPLALVVVDITLPGLDGWAFLEHIKGVPAIAAVPVVIVSIAPDQHRGFAFGAAAVMQKPFSRQQLYEALLGLGLAPRPLGQSLRVLVVDDDPHDVELVALHLRELATTVVRAYDGADAIEAVNLQIPDLIVLDLMMREMSGFEVVEALQQHNDHAHIPIIIVTGQHVTAADRERLNGDVSAILEKGHFDAQLFRAEVFRAVSRPVAVR